MTLWHSYARPTSVREAVQALAAAPGPALPLAGGTDILLDLRQGRHSPVHTIVDLSGIPEMKVVELRGERLFIGAAAPIARLAGHALVGEHARALAEACDLIGGPQVRNVATLGGNVAHALPAADGTIALMSLEAEAQVAGPQEVRSIPLSELFLGPGKSALQSGEIIVGFTIDQRSHGQASAFKRVMRPQGVALPIINLAVWLERDGETVRRARFAVGPGGAVPFRARQAEAFLAGKVFSGAHMTAALERILEEVNFRTSAMRATSAYRYHLAGDLFFETFATAWERALEVLSS